MRFVRLIPLSFLLLGYTANVNAQWIADAAAGYEFNDNLSNSPIESDDKSDSAFAANLSGGQYFQLAELTSLTLTADLGGAKYFKYDGLDNISYGISASLRQKFGLGPYVPWIRFSAATAYYDFQHDPRDGWRHNLSFGVGKRLSERWEVQVNYRYERRNSDHVIDIPEVVRDFGIHGSAFDLEAHSVGLTGIFTVTDRLTAYAGYTRREGDVTSTVRIEEDTIEDIVGAATAIAPDRAFGNDNLAYRANASTNIFSVGLSWAFTPHASANISYEHYDSNARGDLEYPDYANNIARLNFLYSY